MDKRMPTPASNSAASASLLAIAQQLKKTLTHASDFSLSAVQRETLNSFVHAASMIQSSRATSFLQYGARKQPDPFEVFDHYGGGSGGLVATLETLENDVQNERDHGLTEEVESKKHFKEWESELETLIANSKKSMSDMRMSIAQSQQQSSQNEASFLQAKEIHKTEAGHLDEVEAEYRRRTQEYKSRLAKRGDEAIALHEAQRILSSEVAKSYIESGGATSFVQVSREKTEVRRRALQVFSTATTPGLALLALKSTVHYKTGTQTDPFAKVQLMIKEMLDKLMDRQAEETKHAAWCDQEMGKTTKSQRRKEDDIQKMKDRLEALHAELAETDQDINSTSKDLKLMNVSVAEALSVREKEHKNAASAVKVYKEFVALLSNAITVLKSFYKKADKGPQVDDHGMKHRQGVSTGVIGMLEVALDDFKTSHQEAMDAEHVAEHDFQEFQTENRIRTAVFDKDLEYKSRNKVKLEFDESTMRNDLKSYEQELSAVDSYMSKLKASCIVMGPSYEEKKAKREAALKSLKEALSMLMSEKAAR